MTAKQASFVQNYLVDKNATSAAKAAGYSERSAYSQGQRLLKNVEVANAIESGLRDQALKTEITAEKIIKRIAEFAFEDKSVRTSDALKACELLGKHFKLFTERTEVITKGTPQVVLYLPENDFSAQKDSKGIDCNEVPPSVFVRLPDNGRSIDSPLRKQLERI